MTDRFRQGSLDNGRRLPVASLSSPSAAPAHNEAIRIVCAALGLACVVLALRIASMW
jgi:hypothetical protein